MHKPLVSPLENPDDQELQNLITFYNETLGFCPNSVKTMFRRPAIAYAFINLNKAVMENKGNVTSDLKRFVGFISSQHTGCEYCQAHTIRAAERYDATQEKLKHIWDYQTHPAFSEAERVALDFALKSSMIPNQVDDEIATKMRFHWSDDDIVEILGVVALFGFLNRWNDSMGTPIEEGANESGLQYLKSNGWTAGKHNY
jgi:uncharacterized peroxidase-related enzyme